MARRAALATAIALGVGAIAATEPAPPVAVHLEAARSGTPYVVVETSPARVRLMLAGAVLRDYEVVAIDRGVPVVGFVARRGRSAGDVGIPRLVRLEPRCTLPRPEIEAPSAGEAPPDPVVPLRPDELCPCPPRFLARFDSGDVLEFVRAEHEGGTRGGMGERLADLRDAVLAPSVRLRIVLDDDDAGALYRSLSPGTGLIVHAGTDGAGRE